jgi:hypothetical protein
MSRVSVALAVLALSATGCHSKFKKHVGSIDDVRMEMAMPGGPYVALGGVEGDGLLAAAVNITQGVKSIDLTKRINEAVDPADVSGAFTEKLDQVMGKGPPFAIKKNSDTLLQITMEGYGIEVAGLGMPGALTYHLSTRIYLPDGERVYTAGHDCAVPFGDPSAVAVVFGAVNNSKAIKDMSDREIADMFAGGARWCAQLSAMRIRKHGG